nr:MAG TPA: hypothetical protein [Caudoviricetes sp.]
MLLTKTHSNAILKVLPTKYHWRTPAEKVSVRGRISIALATCCCLRIKV